eukprot:jgi/Mesen1/9899/ME000070S09183
MEQTVACAALSAQQAAAIGFAALQKGGARLELKPSLFRKQLPSLKAGGPSSRKVSVGSKQIANSFFTGFGSRTQTTQSWMGHGSAKGDAHNLSSSLNHTKRNRRRSSSGRQHTCSGLYVRADAEGRGPFEQTYDLHEKRLVDKWDVVGLGQAMVDFSGVVDDALIASLALEKGSRKVVDHEERGRVLQALDGCSYKVSAGGSLSNTLVALARLGAVPGAHLPRLHVAMTGSVGSDPLGHFYRTKLARANVHFLSEPIPEGTTGTVVVLTTPDAQRTMLAYQGMSSMVSFDEALEQAVLSSRVLMVEGYLWEIPQTVEAIAQACAAAKERGVTVALTASDVTCILRHRDQYWDVMCKSADILFANTAEARALAGMGELASPARVAQYLSRFCPLVSVTDGDRGSYLALKEEVLYVAPSPCVPADTCGAGDAYAAGVLFGLLGGLPDLRAIGKLAARVAAVVVGQQGTRLREEDAAELATSVQWNWAAVTDEQVVQALAFSKDETESASV